MKPAFTGSLLVVALALGGMTHRLVCQGSDGGGTKAQPAGPGRVNRVPSSPLHSGKVPDIASSMGVRSPEDAAEWLRTLPQETRAEALGIACRRMAARNPAAAASLLAMFPDMVDRGSASDVLREWSWDDPSAAALWIQEGHLPAPITERCLPEVVDAWHGVDRGAANHFIAALPRNEMQGRLLLNASRILTDGDRESACEFVQGLPEPAQRVGAYQRILEVEFREPAARDGAMKWIGDISDSGIRSELLAAAQKCWPEPQPAEPPATSGNGDPFAQ